MKKIINKYDKIAKRNISCITHGKLNITFSKYRRATGNLYITEWYQFQIPLEKRLKQLENENGKVDIIYYTPDEVMVKSGKKQFYYLCLMK